MNQVKCQKCGGSGFFSEYGHIEGGRCFKCQGTGFSAEYKEKASEAQATVKQETKKTIVMKGQDCFFNGHYCDELSAHLTQDDPYSFHFQCKGVFYSIPYDQIEYVNA